MDDIPGQGEGIKLTDDGRTHQVKVYVQTTYTKDFVPPVI